MRVLVVARTKMRGDRVCVGCIDIDSGRSLHLHGSDLQNLPESHPIRPGEIWNVSCTPKQHLRPPHLEDVVVTAGRRLSGVANRKEAILDLVQPWNGSLDQIFDGRMAVTPSGTAFLRDESPLPPSSTGFWIARGSVERFDQFGVRYRFTGSDAIRKAKYVGMEEPIVAIPNAALIRFSLARWAEFPPGVGEKRCYLQLSGWYL